MKYDDLSYVQKARVDTLFAAVKSGETDRFMTILESLKEIPRNEIADRYRDSVLSVAVKEYRPEVVEFLLTNGFSIQEAMVSSPAKRAVNCLFIARTPDMLKILVEHGADVNSKDVQTGDDTLLQHLAGADRMRLVRDVLAYGADVHATNHNGQTAAHTAAQFARLSMLEQLIERGADMNVRDRWGSTPLMYAVQQVANSPLLKDGASVVELLATQPGVDFAQKNNDGKSLLQLAKKNDAIKRILRAAKITNGIDVAMTEKDKPVASSASYSGPSL